MVMIVWIVLMVSGFLLSQLKYASNLFCFEPPAPKSANLYSRRGIVEGLLKKMNIDVHLSKQSCTA
jgi:hypothetical protein